MTFKTWIAGTLLITTVGCSSMNNTEKGMLGGAGVGTAAEALIGRGHPGAMIVGGILGTAVGGMAGSNQDRREDHRNAAIAAANAQSARQMNLNEVVQMAQQNTPEQIIINQIESTGSNFNLRSEDILYLQQQGVSARVISVMQTPRYRRAVVVQPAPVYVVDPGPPPPVVGIGVGVRGGF